MIFPIFITQRSILAISPQKHHVAPVRAKTYVEVSIATPNFTFGGARVGIWDLTPILIGVLLKMEVGIRKGAWRRV